MKKKRIVLASTDFTKAPGRYLEDVFRGAEILVTRYGRPFALVVPPPEEESPEDKSQHSR